MRQSLVTVADLERAFNDDWFRRQFRCNKFSFEILYRMVEDNRNWLHESIHCYFRVYYKTSKFCVLLAPALLSRYFRRKC